ncbi:hypothetical protein LTR86_002982 [Recurvomyces mirabilis]|nr:hypothetical protein LTR86_002982 [Recurvomyces mirabilis]
MPPTRQPPHDPFTDAPLRPTTGNPSFRSQTSQSSLRSNASNASARPRPPQQTRDLFAPALSRRPTSRTTPRVEDDVLADPDSEEEIAVMQRQRQRQARDGLRTVRQGSPEKGGAQYHGRRGAARREEEDVDIVNRQADGNYMLDVSGMIDVQAMGVPLNYPSAEIGGRVEDEDASTDTYYAAVARQYFTSGRAMGGRSVKGGAAGDDVEELVPEMMAHLRRQATRKLEDERWMYEPTPAGSTY